MRKIDTPPGYSLVPRDCIVATAEQRRALSIGEEDAGKLIIQKDTGRMSLATLTEGARDLTGSHAAEHAAMGKPFAFSNYRRSLLASLVISSTAARTSNIVTVTATAHGITTGSTYVGFRFFYPGSPSLTAGWYESIVSIPDANTITFNATGADFGSESINGAAAYTTLTDVASMTLPAAVVSEGAQITVSGHRGGDTTATSKSIRVYINGNNISTASTTSSPFSRFVASMTLTSDKAYGAGNLDNLLSVTEYVQTVPLGADATLLVKASVAAASAFITIPSMIVSVA